MKIIRFFSDKKFEDLGRPVPAKVHIPAWYKQGESAYIDDNGGSNPGLKACIPYLDSLVSGYVLTTPFDIFVKKDKDGKLAITWNGPDSLSHFVNERPEGLGATMPRPAGHYKNHLVWSGFWGIKTPRGWSLLVTHPLNRFDLPFTTTSGIIDSDMFSASGNIPFFIKEDFIGTIPAGTPIAQLIPIKRSSWKMIANDQSQMNLEHIQGSFVRSGEAVYKKNLWTRKEYS